jgi:hypothetical protein
MIYLAEAIYISAQITKQAIICMTWINNKVRFTRHLIRWIGLGRHRGEPQRLPLGDEIEQNSWPEVVNVGLAAFHRQRLRSEDRSLWDRERICQGEMPSCDVVASAAMKGVAFLGDGCRSRSSGALLSARSRRYVICSHGGRRRN